MEAGSKLKDAMHMLNRNGFKIYRVTPYGLELIKFHTVDIDNYMAIKNIDIDKIFTKQVEIFNKRQLATLMVDVGDKEIVRELVIKFIGELPEKIMDMEKDLLVGNYDHLQKIAHELVSISGTYGFRQLSEILRNIEQAAIRSDKQTMVDEVALAMKQCEEIQGPLADFMVDCGVHNAQ